MNNQQFIQALKSPDLLDQSTLPGLKEMIDNYPFFPLARMLYLRNLKNINSYKFEQELVKHAIFIPNRAVLYRMLCFQARKDEGFELLPYDEEEFKEFFEANEESEKNTVDEFDYHITDAIRLIDNLPVLDDAGKKEPDDLIEKFISGGADLQKTNKIERGSISLLSDQSNQVGEELITETLAKVYLKQGLYDEALQSYEKLILKFPEKNSYFAGQIENIKKLISKES